MIDSMECFDGSQKVFEMPANSSIVKFITEVNEQQDEFIFTHLQKYCEDEAHVTHITRVPKRLLLRALICFKEEHQEEYKVLMGVESEVEDGTSSDKR